MLLSRFRIVWIKKNRLALIGIPYGVLRNERRKHHDPLPSQFSTGRLSLKIPRNFLPTLHL